MTLVLFGVVGTFVTAGLISAGAYCVLRALGIDSRLAQDSLALGTIWTASDSVAALQVLSQDRTPMLHSIVFGEGVVNDATALVLLRALDKFRWGPGGLGGFCWLLRQRRKADFRCEPGPVAACRD